ncbi:MAG: UDP-2,3-diacylglucosamine diphosphatase [Acidithiobacillus ferrivorans]
MLFISDLHLSPAQPALTTLFRHFCAHEGRAARAVFILGDLFDYWVHRDQAVAAPYAEIFVLLHDLQQQGTAVYLMVGNRDFALEADFLAQFSIIALPDPTLLQLGDERILLTHGDLLCSDDHRYQRFRRVIRHPLTRLTLGRLPYAWLQRIARGLRRGSSREVRAKASTITDANPQTIVAALHGEGAFALGGAPYDILLHGHTHRPVWEQGPAGRRMVLGAWGADGAQIGRWENGQWSLQLLSPP